MVGARVHTVASLARRIEIDGRRENASCVSVVCETSVSRRSGSALSLAPGVGGGSTPRAPPRGPPAARACRSASARERNPPTAMLIVIYRLDLGTVSDFDFELFIFDIDILDRSAGPAIL
jgi:hypothetical protein